jgi:hypothetical protein
MSSIYRSTSTVALEFLQDMELGQVQSTPITMRVAL